MLARLCLLLLAVLCLAWSAGDASAATRPSAAVEAASATTGGGPTIEADLAPCSDAARAAEGPEVLTVVTSTVVTTDASAGHAARGARPGFAPPALWAVTWCDVVQCRRSGGEQLLRYATPPPTGG
jgi:hypothetical protein